MPETSMYSTINFKADGKHTGYVHLPHSVHRSGYGVIPIPVASIRNGDGPRVLVLGGVHGDEYEGQLVVSELIRMLSPDDITGHLILMPMANFPAAEAGLRTSPIDQGNLNRLFPGDPDGTPSLAIADYIENMLMAGCDFVMDLHSGGESMAYAKPTGMMQIQKNDPKADLKRKIMDAYGLPYFCIYRSEGGGFSSAAALRQGAISVFAEFGGGGAVNPKILQMARQGVRRVLQTIGLLGGPPVQGSAAAPVCFPDAAYVFAPEPGVVELLAGCGDTVQAGDTAALIHYPESPGREPTSVQFDKGGTVLAVNLPARVRRGACLYHLGTGA
ncbi:MAG: succinylglutamate desuccinylase/aspartoacylase family protein [Alphaproteobacteria bacterium]